MRILTDECTGHHAHCADVEKCKETLQLILDGEISLSQEEITKKLEKCLPCFQHFELGKCLKESLQQKLQQREVPGELIERIKSGIKTVL